MAGMAVVGGVFMVLAMLAVIALVVWAFVTLINIGRQTKKNAEETAAIRALLQAHIAGQTPVVPVPVAAPVAHEETPKPSKDDA